ncbi:hypothetical protein BO94DRAFT_597969 [Aspergillus sclerotioniger CBS 115572]|uniref:Uncharacterized protein n=1 Tax=Aspergillus sclerotioniger CBS 115572 TaxID=1450535 RepID=A0A317WHR8_9EURO|nr:hypothetical protein BO94DRAFT_597969 [Aspergillus sclerotioniger CBS 115572]PWY85819.1 hypothetical protein BO94DRAFT_597969 [Aspergillus sclerotioniger CBS 115572]
MPVTESPKRQELRAVLRAVTNHVASLEAHEYDSNQLEKHKIQLLPMDLNDSKPTFFTPCLSSLLLNPDEDYEQERPPGYYDFDSIDPISRRPIDCARNMINYFSYYVFACACHSKDKILDRVWSGKNSIGDVPFVGLIEYNFPEYACLHAIQVKEGSYPHLKALLYNDLNATDGKILRGEIMIALRLIIAQMRRSRFLQHMTTPVLLFSFMGPQQARLIEAYFNGSSLVMRTTRLFDLRKKDEELVKTLGQWYFGDPVGDTKSPW